MLLPLRVPSCNAWSLRNQLDACLPGIISSASLNAPRSYLISTPHAFQSPERLTTPTTLPLLDREQWPRATTTAGMASFKFKDAAFTVDSPDVTYTEEEILAKYTYETVVVEGTKV